MTKQELAEWLAENVLGWEFIKGAAMLDYWTVPNVGGILSPDKLEEFIYSPEGFFEVWDAVENSRGPGWVIIFKVCEDGKFICTSELWGEPFCMGKGDDRYEAFYNAVHEAMKK